MIDLRSGRGDRIRTCDILIPNEARLTKLRYTPLSEHQPSRCFSASMLPPTSLFAAKTIAPTTESLINGHVDKSLPPRHVKGRAFTFLSRATTQVRDYCLGLPFVVTPSRLQSLKAARIDYFRFVLRFLGLLAQGA